LTKWQKYVIINHEAMMHEEIAQILNVSENDQAGAMCVGLCWCGSPRDREEVMPEETVSSGFVHLSLIA
jgi:hypothetical protein